MSKFAAPNDAMRAAKNRATPDKYFFIPPAKFRETYAADVSAPEAQFMADSEQQLAENAMRAPISAAAWRNKPSYAILTTQDHVVSPQLQRWMYQRSGAKVTEVSASHAVFISQPAIVAQVIETAANQTISQ
jgi:pimeloyl-ACP methyl ester carboxylesterase